MNQGNEQVLGNPKSVGSWKEKLSRIPKKKVGIILGIVIVLIILLLVGIKLFTKKEKLKYENFRLTDAFFIENENGEYALFNESGKQLTEFTFSSVDSFYGGVTKVSNKNGEDALINEKGKYVIPFTKDYIHHNYSLYKISNDETQKDTLLNFQGKKIMEDTYLTIETFSDYALYLVQTVKDVEEKKERVFNYQGKQIDTVPAGTYSISSEIYDGYITLMNEDTTYVYQLDMGKKILTTDGKYCMAGAQEGTILLSSCSSWYESDEVKKYKVIQKGKEKYSLSKEECNASLTEKGEVICRNSDGTYDFVDGKGTIQENHIAGYLSSKDYVVEDKDTHEIHFYQNGKEVSSVSCATYEASLEDGYILRNYTYGDCDVESGYIYYSKKGEKLSDRYYAASPWDENGYAIVASEYQDYYLIDKDFKKVSDSYQRIRNYGKLYLASKEKDYELLDNHQKILETGIEEYDTATATKKKEIFIGVEKDGKVTVYNATTQKKVGEVEGKDIRFTDHYYLLGNVYYSYQTGKSFYTAN